MAVLTIYNHGTGNDSKVKVGKTSVINLLYDHTAGADKFLTEGVGSGMDVASKDGKLAKAKAKVAGNLFGSGVEANVDRAVTWAVDRAAKVPVNLVNICGFSRGAVTCFKQAVALHANPATQNVPVRVFAIDPVPGCAGMFNSHMYKDIEISANVCECFVILAETERRKTFRPVLDHRLLPWSNANHDLFGYDQMPGNHQGIVDNKADSPDLACAPELVFEWAKDFLQNPHAQTGLAGGTRFLPDQLQPTAWWLDRYSRIMLAFDQYIRAGRKGTSLSGGLAWFTDTSTRGGTGGLTEHRAPRLKTESGSVMYKNDWHGATDPTVVLKSNQSRRAGQGALCRFFANRDHRDLFRQSYLALAECLIEAEHGDPSKLIVGLSQGPLGHGTDPQIATARAQFQQIGNDVALGSVYAHIQSFLGGVVNNWA